MATPKCFVIAPLGPANSVIRERSDQVFDYIIEPAVRQFGYEPIRADRIAEPGIITDQVIRHIVGDELVIADLTGHNPNVFYELAIRHAVCKPFIQMISCNETIPFDVQAVRTILVDHTDVKSVFAARHALERAISALAGGDLPVATPFSTALELPYLRQQHGDIDANTAHILAILSEIRMAVAGLTQNNPLKVSLAPNRAQRRGVSPITADVLGSDQLRNALMTALGSDASDARLVEDAATLSAALLKLKRDPSWVGQALIKTVQRLFNHVERFARTLAEINRSDTTELELPGGASTVANEMLVAQIEAMSKGDRFISLSDITSWAGSSLQHFMYALARAVERGVHVRRIMLRFSHDSHLTREVVVRILRTHWTESLLSTEGSDGRPRYEFGIVTRQVAMPGVESTVVFTHNRETVVFRPKDATNNRIGLSRSYDRILFEELWSEAIKTAVYDESARCFKPQPFEKALSACDEAWWRQ